MTVCGNLGFTVITSSLLISQTGMKQAFIDKTSLVEELQAGGPGVVPFVFRSVKVLQIVSLPDGSLHSTSTSGRGYALTCRAYRKLEAESSMRTEVSVK